MPVRYIVSSVKTAVEFYTRALRCELLEEWGTAIAMVKLPGEGGTLWLAGPDSSAGKMVSHAGERAKPGGWNRIVFTVTDVEAVLKTALEHGAKTRADLTAGPGGKQVVIEAPDGNPIELFEPR